MDQTPKRSNYNSPLRLRQKEQTRELILEAVAQVMRGAGLGAVTISEVAKVAEVTERTVYRHFSTREELLRAFWKWQLIRSGGDRVTTPESADALYDTIKRLFRRLDADEGIIRAIVMAPEGGEMRRDTNQQRLATMIEFLKPLVPTMSARDRHQMAAGIISVCSILSWMFMRDNCGYDGKRAGEAAAFAVQLMIEGARARETVAPR